MTPGESWALLLLAWGLLLLVIFLAAWGLDLLEQRSFDRHAAEAMAQARDRHPSRPVGPEESDWWADR